MPILRSSTARSALGLVAAAVALGAATAPAQASDVSVVDGAVRFTAAPGEVNDVYYFADRATGDLMLGDVNRSSTITTSACAPSNGYVRCPGWTGRVELDLGDRDDSIISTASAGDPLPNYVVVDAGAGDDELRTHPDAYGPTALYGGEGRDSIITTGGPDELHGGPGDDVLFAGGGADSLEGDAGDDILDGDGEAAPAPDVLDGGSGHDQVKGWWQPDDSLNRPISITVDEQADDGRPGEGDLVRDVESFELDPAATLTTTDADDEVGIYNFRPHAKGSVVRTLGGADRVTAVFDGDDVIDAGAGDDRVQGGSGDDEITGGPGRDELFGDSDQNCPSCSGDDVIQARDGEVDQVHCGPGTDRAIVDAVDVVAPDCEQVDRPGGTPPPTTTTTTTSTPTVTTTPPPTTTPATTPTSSTSTPAPTTSVPTTTSPVTAATVPSGQAGALDGARTATSVPAGQVPVATASASEVAIALRPGTLRLRDLRRGKARLVATTSGPASLRLRLSSGLLTVATGRARVSAAGVVRIRLSKPSRRALADVASRGGLLATLRAVPTGGGDRVTTTQTYHVR